MDWIEGFAERRRVPTKHVTVHEFQRSAAAVLDEVESEQSVVAISRYGRVKERALVAKVAEREPRPWSPDSMDELHAFLGLANRLELEGLLERAFGGHRLSARARRAVSRADVASAQG